MSDTGGCNSFNRWSLIFWFTGTLTSKPWYESSRTYSHQYENRAVSPLIGVILLVSGTVILAAVVGPFILSATSGVGDDTPDVELRFAYSEDVDFESGDSYGTTGTAAGADGLLTITLEDGDRLEANRVTVAGGASGGLLTDGDSLSDGDTLGIGDPVTVWVNRSDQIEVLWNNEDEDQSELLDRFTVFPLSSGQPGIPEPDYDCSGWDFEDDFDDVSGITASSGDLTINGVILECDLDNYDIDSITIENDGANIGNVEADNDITIKNGATYEGYIKADTSNVVIKEGSDVDSEFIESVSGNVDIEDDSTAGVSQYLKDGNGINVRQGSTINGDIVLSGSGQLNIDPGGVVTGNINIETDKQLDADSADIGGDINLNHAGASIGELNDVTVNGEIDGVDATSYGDVKIENGTKIKGGGITTHGTVVIKSGSIVKGDVTTDTSSATVEYGGSGSSKVTGEVYAGTLDCEDSSSTIDGQSCSDYKTPEYIVTIDGTNEPVEEGSELDVTATIENTGIDQGDQTVTFDINGSQEDSASLQIDGGSAVTETFRWSTTNGDKGTHTAEVSSDDDSKTVSVEVTVDKPDVDVLTTSGKNDAVRVDDWEVSAGEADLDSVEIEVIDPDTGNVEGTQTYTVSGDSASDKNVKIDGLTDGKTYDVKLTVTDVDGNQKTQTKQQTAG